MKQDEQLTWIRDNVSEWAQEVYQTKEIIVGLATIDETEDESGSSRSGQMPSDGTRFLVDLAVRDVGFWLVAEVWILDGQILGINDLGEGLPMENTEWPWG